VINRAYIVKNKKVGTCPLIKLLSMIYIKLT
jgi:hypothetical protein